MILDKLNEFIDGGSLALAAGTHLLGDVIDIGPSLRDIGNGQPIYWYVALTEAAAGGTSIAFHLVTADDAALTVNAVAVAQTPAIPLADLTAGKLAAMIALPLEGVAYRRYLGLHAIVVGTFTDGSVDSGLTLDPHGWRAYPEGLN